MAKAVKGQQRKPAARRAVRKRPRAHDELFAQYWDHPDTDTLRIWADALIVRGDLRGEYIQMCLVENESAEQRANRVAFEKKHHTKLAVPAREFLREFVLGTNGLVERARCEADLLAAGLHEIEQLNPHFMVSVTSADAKGDALAHCSLERIYHVSFAYGMLGSQGGCNMKDATLVKIAPALRRVRNLSLQCTSYVNKCFTPAALRVLGETVESLEHLTFMYFDAARQFDPTRRGLAPIEEYAEVIATAPGFKSLQVVFMRGLADPAILYTLPKVVHVETSQKDVSGSDDRFDLPVTFDEIEPLKQHRR
ncbi:MAG: hypothetical protein M4D80_41220 [Myxococcota bacterium]|nr:hypothetical protein [Myxococcota bacterium]